MSEDVGIRVAVDIGGTFTDVVVTAGDSIAHTAKVLTTYADLLDAVRVGINAGLSHVEQREPRIGTTRLLHATTLVSNSYIERKGSPVSILTTRGFGDSIVYGDGSRFDVWDLSIEYSQPFTPLDVVELTERMDYRGTPLVAPALDELAMLADRLHPSVALVFLHSYENPAHERQVGERLRSLRPDLELSLSSDVSREVGEFERMTTAAANAFVKPLVKPYLARLDDEARRQLGEEAALLVMLSSGGLTPAETAAELPVRIVESGPAAGVTAAHAYVAASTLLEPGRRQAVSLDMGGTTAKIAFVDGDEPLRLRTSIEVARDSRHRRGSGIPLLVPSLDLVEIGAGGGSIARRDQFGLIDAGPESASSEPGPAAYGRGGSEPTVTDANAVLGYIPATQRLGGLHLLQPDLARAALARLGPASSVEDIAFDVHSIANEHMSAALRVAAAERGLLPESHVLVAFGGAAPLHACGVAARVGIRTVVIPPEPGVFSALGLALAPLKYEAVRSWRVTLPFDSEEAWTAAAAVEEMTRDVAAVLGEDFEPIVLADVRFVEQHLAVTVPLGPEVPSAHDVYERFASEYRRLYARLPDATAEVVNLRMRGVGPRPRVRLELAHMPTLGDAETMTSAVFADRNGRPERVDVPVISRNGRAIRGSGPMLLTESHSTTVVPPGWRWRRHVDGSLLLQDCD